MTALEICLLSFLIFAIGVAIVNVYYENKYRNSNKIMADIIAMQREENLKLKDTLKQTLEYFSPNGLAPMQYLIICDGYEPAYTKWFDAENNFNAELNMVVFDLVNHVYMDDGKTWKDINFDHL